MTIAPKAYLVGGGIASLAAAAFLIRDGDVLGRDITILEESEVIGGSLDGAGSPEKGYVLRGGRMFESKYLCTFELFSSIPTLDGKPDRHAGDLRLERDHQDLVESRAWCATAIAQDAPEFGLSESTYLTIERWRSSPRGCSAALASSDQFDPAFFKTDFWFMWCTTFAFQPWHSAVEFKRYLVRFAHMVGGFNRLQGIMRTVYNQYDSLVRPLRKWLDERGVVFELNTPRHRSRHDRHAGVKTVEQIVFTSATAKRADRGRARRLRPRHAGFDDGGIEPGLYGRARRSLKGKADGGAWTLWETIAAGRPEFGHPSVFADHIDESKWVSFTTTLHDPTFLRIVRDLTGNVPGEGGLITFPQSSWLASIVIPHQPHFIGQPDDVSVFWGYGLFVDKPGDFVKKPMSACTGPRDHDRSAGPSRVRDELADDPGTRDLHSLHDAIHHQPVSAARKGRSAGRRPEGIEKSGLHGPVLRAAGGRRVHRRIFDPLGADRRLCTARAEPKAATGLSRQVRPARPL